MQNTETSPPAPQVIYGVPFHNVTPEEAIDWIIARARAGHPAQVVTANLDVITQAWSDPELHQILLNADLVLADGFPVVKLSPFFGPRLKARVTGSDLTPLLAERVASEGLRLYGLGSAAGVAEKSMQILKKRHPALNVVGSYSPPFLPLKEMDHAEILQRLETARPDILLVGLGVPKQEKFIHMHLRKWSVPVAIGVGASLDFIAGEQCRAPRWVQHLNLEWFWRLCCDPRRLFRRYTTNLCFLLRTTCQMIRIHQTPDRPATFQTLEKTEVQWLKKNSVAVGNFQTLETGSASDANHLLIDLHATPWINSQKLGILLDLNKRYRAQGNRLIPYAPRPKVLRLLETCHLNTYFDIATQMKTLEKILLLPNSDDRG